MSKTRNKHRGNGCCRSAAPSGTGTLHPNGVGLTSNMEVIFETQEGLSQGGLFCQMDVCTARTAVVVHILTPTRTFTYLPAAVHAELPIFPRTHGNARRMHERMHTTHRTATVSSGCALELYCYVRCFPARHSSQGKLLL